MALLMALMLAVVSALVWMTVRRIRAEQRLERAAAVPERNQD
jgi:hypothetical protein